MKKRMDWLDLAKGIGVILIITGHAGSVPKSLEFQVAIYGFHVPLFFFLAGITFKHNLNISFQKLLKKLFINLVVPYIVCTLLICVFDSIWTRFEGGMAPFINQMNAFFIQIRANALWFIPVLCMCEIICWIIFQVFNSRNKRAFIIIILCLAGMVYARNWNIPLTQNVDIVPFACVYVHLGMEWFQKDAMTEQSSLKHFLLFLMFIGISYLSSYFNYFSQTGDTIAGIGMYENYYHIYLLFLVSSLSGIYSVIHFSMLLKQLPIINMIGKNTYSYFALHQNISFLVIGAFPLLKQAYQTSYIIIDLSVYLFLNFIILFPLQYLVSNLNKNLVRLFKYIDSFYSN